MIVDNVKTAESQEIAVFFNDCFSTVATPLEADLSEGKFSVM